MVCCLSQWGSMERSGTPPMIISGVLPLEIVHWWCIKLWDITSLGSVQVVGFFDVAARVCAGGVPIAELVGGTGCGLMVNLVKYRKLQQSYNAQFIFQYSL